MFCFLAVVLPFHRYFKMSIIQLQSQQQYHAPCLCRRSSRSRALGSLAPLSPPYLWPAFYVPSLARSLGRSLARPSGTHDDEGREAPRRRATAPKLMLVLFIAMRACALSAPPPLPPCACDLRRFHDFSASLSLLTIQKMQRSSHCRWGSLSEVENCSNCVFTCGKASRSTCDILRVGGGGLWFSLFSLENLATKC